MQSVRLLRCELLCAELCIWLLQVIILVEGLVAKRQKSPLPVTVAVVIFTTNCLVGGTRSIIYTFLAWLFGNTTRIALQPHLWFASPMPKRIHALA